MRNRKEKKKNFSLVTLAMFSLPRCMWTVHYSIALLQCFLMERSSLSLRGEIETK